MNRIALTCCLTLPSSLATSMASYELRRSLQTAHCSEGVHQSSTGRTQLQSQATLLLALGTRQCTHLPPLFSPSYCLSQSPPSSPLSFPLSLLSLLPLSLDPPSPSVSPLSTLLLPLPLCSSFPLPPSLVPHLICVVRQSECV